MVCAEGDGGKEDEIDGQLDGGQDLVWIHGSAMIRDGVNRVNRLCLPEDSI